MANSRDYRRDKYYRAVTEVLGDRFFSEESGLDQVIFNPQRMVCVAPRGESRIDPALLERVRAIPGVSEDKDGAGQREGSWVFDVPWARGEDCGPTSAEIAFELAGDFPDQVAPEYYCVTQQYLQPGEDPEYGRAPAAAGAAQDEGALGRGIRIAVLDSGIDPLAVGPAPGHVFDNPADVDLLSDLSVPNVPAGEAVTLGPAAGHGTFIASLIQAVAPGATVISIKVASAMGVVSESDVVTGLEEALRRKADIISLSFGGYRFAKNEKWPALAAFPLLERAIAAVPEEIAVVAAAGNCSSHDPFYPAAFERVVGVAALDQLRAQWGLWEHSNYGTWVKACAPGVGLNGAFVRGRENPVYDPDQAAESWTAPDGQNFATWSGTSFAAPLVAAQIAIVAAQLGLAHDTATAARQLLAMSAPPPSRADCGKRVLVHLPGQT